MTRDQDHNKKRGSSGALGGIQKKQKRHGPQQRPLTATKRLKKTLKKPFSAGKKMFKNLNCRNNAAGAVTQRPTMEGHEANELPPVPAPVASPSCASAEIARPKASVASLSSASAAHTATRLPGSNGKLSTGMPLQQPKKPVAPALTDARVATDLADSVKETPVTTAVEAPLAPVTTAVGAPLATTPPPKRCRSGPDESVPSDAVPVSSGSITSGAATSQENTDLVVSSGRNLVHRDDTGNLDYGSRLGYGLTNDGNHCFAIAVLQCLFSYRELTRDLQQMLKQRKDMIGTNDRRPAPLIRSFLRLDCSRFLSNQQLARSVTETLTDDKFMDMGEHDPQEYLGCLFDQMCTELDCESSQTVQGFGQVLPPVANMGPATYLCGWQLETRLTCCGEDDDNRCHFSSKSSEVSLVFSLPVPEDPKLGRLTVQGCLNSFLAAESVVHGCRCGLPEADKSSKSLIIREM